MQLSAAQSGQMNQLSQVMGNAAKDGRITKNEAKELNKWIDQSGMSNADKESMKAMVGELKDATNGQFLFFSWKSKVSSSEMQDLTQLAGKNPLAAKLLEQFNSVQEAPMPVSNSQRSSFLDRAMQRANQSANFSPNSGVGFPPTGQTTGAPVSAPSSGATASQFINPDGTRSATGSADCGPSCAYMILGDQGENPNVSKYTDMRRTLGSDRQGSKAVSRDDIAKMLSKFSHGRVKRATADKPFQRGQSANMIAHMREQLAQGNSVMMLNGGFGGTKGHYTVVKSVNGDGSVTFRDPGGGRERTVSAGQLEEMMKNRANGGRGPAYVMAFN